MEIYLIKDGDLISVSSPQAAETYINEGYVEYSKESVQVKVIKDKLYAVKRIEELKQLLASSDYKMMKCYEAFIANETMPYDFNLLKEQRQSWRNEVNQLEGL